MAGLPAVPAPRAFSIAGDELTWFANLTALVACKACRNCQEVRRIHPVGLRFVESFHGDT